MRASSGVPVPFQPTFGLADNCHLSQLNGRTILFHERTQRLMDLNADASLLASILARPASFITLIEDVVACGIARDEAVDFLRTVLAQWSRDGVVEARSPTLPNPDYIQKLNLSGINIGIGYGNPVVAQRVIPIFGHLERPAGAADLHYHIHEHHGLALVGRDRDPMKIVRVDQAGPVLKSLIVEDMIERPGSLAALHAACLIRDGEAMLLCGAPGTGKSVLTMALIDQALGYGGDDIALLEADGRVSGLPFAITAKAGAWKYAKAAGDVRDIPVHLRLDDRKVRYIPPPAAFQQTPAEVGWIVRLRRSATGAARFKTRETVDALGDLIREGRSPSGRMNRATFDMLHRMASRARCVTLEYSDASDAAQLLRTLSRHG